MRRCGKSTLLNMFQQHLLESGVASNQIISVNFEAMEYESLLNYDGRRVIHAIDWLLEAGQ